LEIKELKTQQDLENSLTQVLNELKKTILNDLDFKQAKLLTYWLNDWNEKFLKNEKQFDPKKLIKYRRGNIVSVHLGYNIGSEQGGLHYGLVIDNNNEKSSKVITIIPLRSLKDNEKPEDIDDRFELYLGDAILTDKIKFLENQIAYLDEQIKQSTIKDKSHILCSRKRDRYIKELNNLKKGSVAIVSQIRTISKMRIYEPIKAYHSLSNFILSTDKLNEIDNMIKKLFLGKTIDT